MDSRTAIRLGVAVIVLPASTLVLLAAGPLGWLVLLVGVSLVISGALGERDRLPTRRPHGYTDCPDCGTHNVTGRTVCRDCGAGIA
ncbi:hypothetical protein [Haloprofundus salinisoli]|uniref:hypothetical protein n=1 Tax=Haloprofundus salinisoli TaxID=2876193 RepID=UPI001CC9A7DA|nr:hypothetical protein [Haloprofundus salinisoli]